MLDFKKLTLDDIETIKPYFSYSGNRTCDNTVGGTFIWRDYFSTEYALYNDTYISKMKIKYHGDITAFSFPLGDDVIGSINEIESYCDVSEIPVVFCKVTQNELPLLKAVYHNTRISQESNWSDYVYKAADLKNLSGRKYHGQKNHVNFFRRQNADYMFEIITGDNVSQVINFYNSLNIPLDNVSDIFMEDHIKTLEVLENYDTYNLPGAFIRTGGNIVAFAIGEVLGDVLYIHVEKADLSYRGSYQIINNEFAKHFAADNVEFINREDDADDPGLRIAKQAYHPAMMIDKYIVEVI